MSFIWYQPSILIITIMLCMPRHWFDVKIEHCHYYYMHVSFIWYNMPRHWFDVKIEHCHYYLSFIWYQPSILIITIMLCMPRYWFDVKIEHCHHYYMHVSFIWYNMPRHWFDVKIEHSHYYYMHVSFIFISAEHSHYYYNVMRATSLIWRQKRALSLLLYACVIHLI